MIVFLTLIGLSVASAARAGKFLPHGHHMSLEAKVSYFKRSLRHERQVVAWLESGHAPRTLERHSELGFYRAAEAWHERLLTRYSAKLEPHYTNAGAICAVFGPYCQQALAVASCESGLSIYARNGQYLGLFQEGDYARAAYGFGWDALAQARSAFAYFRASGYRWTAWECQP